MCYYRQILNPLAKAVSVLPLVSKSLFFILLILSDWHMFFSKIVGEKENVKSR